MWMRQVLVLGDLGVAETPRRELRNSKRVLGTLLARKDRRSVLPDFAMNVVVFEVRDGCGWAARFQRRQFFFVWP